MSRRGKLGAFLPPLAVAAAGLVVSFPCWLHGMGPGSDTVFHSSWVEHFSAQVWSGELYPRWLAGMNGGLGSPVFFYYSPLPYHVASLIKPLVPDGAYNLRLLGFATALSVVASGLAAYAWLRAATGSRAAAATAAALYLLMPYHAVVDLFMRGAFTEMWAFVWMPLVLHFARGTRTGSRRAAAGLAASYALLVLTHLPATLLFSVVPLCYACLAARRRARAALRTAAAMALGAGLAAVYLLPALTMQDAVAFADMHAYNYFERWLNFKSASVKDLNGQTLWGVTTALGLIACAALLCRTRPDATPQHDSPRETTADETTTTNEATTNEATTGESMTGESTPNEATTNEATMRVETTAGNEAGARFRGATRDELDLQGESSLRGEATLRGESSLQGESALRRELFFWSAVAVPCVLMMTFVSDVAWRLVPVVQRVQFPWRFNLVLCVASAGAVGAGLARLRGCARVNRRALAFACLLASSWVAFWAGAAWRYYPETPRRGFTPHGEMRKWMDRGRDAPEYRPASSSSNAETDIELFLRRVCGDARPDVRACVSEGVGTVAVERSAPRQIDLRVESPGGVTFHVTQFHFPGWTAYLDGRPHALSPSKPEGFLTVSAPAGSHRLRLSLEATAPELAGRIVSAASAALLLLWLAQPRLLRSLKRRG